MSLNPDIRDQAYQFFIEEAQELLQVLEDGLLNLRDDHSTSKVHELMRAAHSIKGGAASVELDTIKLIAHRLEDFFKALYSEKVDFDSNLESLLLKAYDGLREPLTEQMELGSFDEEIALLNVEPVFDELQEILGEALQESDSYIPSATDLGVDIVSSIFEIDVQQSLDHLNSMLANPAGFDLVGEFEAQLEVLGGFAELFTLPGFSEIIKLGSTAISLNPDRAVEVITIFGQNCQQARDLVVAGDREKGGEPSEELIAIANSETTVATSQESLAPTATVDDNLEDLFDDILSYAEEGVASSSGNSAELFELSAEDSSEEMDSVFDFAPSMADDADWDDLSTGSAEIDDAFDFAPSAEAELDWGALPVESETSETELTDNLSDNAFDFAPSAEAELDWGALPVESETSETELTNNAFDFASSTEMDEMSTEFYVEDAEEADNRKPVSFLSAVEQEVNRDELPVASTAAEPEDATDISKFTIGEVNNSESRTISSPQIETNSDQIIPQEPESQFATPQNLDKALDSIPEIFTQLPEAKTEELALPEIKSKSRSIAARPKADRQQGFVKQLSVRVDLERLERMNNLIGELVINRNSLSLQNEQLQSNVKSLTQKFSRFRAVTSKLRELSDQMVIESGYAQNQLATSKANSSILRDADGFDALEMDSYNQLQLLLQDILEEMLQLEEGVDDVSLFAQLSDRTINSQRQMLGQMRDELMWARMLPLEQILKRFPRTLRDLSNQYKKPVALNLIGTGVLVDKAVLEKLYDPLLHLLRNGFDHGIESPEVRSQKGKPKTGQIDIHAYYQGNQTIIEVRDDGKGLDIQKIANKAVKNGLISAEEVAISAPEDLFSLIFEPGFSTAEKVSEISGRGVGMSVVREQIEALKGSISVTSTPDKGSTFTLALPLTLTIAKLLVVALEATAFALPSDSIEEIIIPLPNQITTSGGQRFLQWNNSLVSIYNLEEMLPYNCEVMPLDNESKVLDSVSAPTDWALPLLLFRRGRQLFALEVDRLIVEQELVIKPFGKTLSQPNYLYGCTILGDGTLIPVLNSSILVGENLGEYTSSNSTVSSLPTLELEPDLAVETLTKVPETTPQEKVISQDSKTTKSSLKQKKIMIVDDSTALRRTMALSLERQGYRIIQAKDGRDAVEQLQKNYSVDLIVCDIEMPHMNGFEFLGVRRRDSEMKQIPTIMLTSRSGVKHRNLALQLGADGYFTKPYVEQEFIQELDRILNQKNNSDVDSGRFKNSKITSNSKSTVLIIDDSSALRKTLALSLTNKNYRVLEARDGEEGIEKMYQNREIDLVVCDVEMPKMNGFEVLEARAQDQDLKQIPVAMLTSRNTEKHRNLADKLGANAFFSKPYVEKTFISKIEKLIKTHRTKN